MKFLVLLLSIIGSLHLTSAQYSTADAFEFAAASALAYCAPNDIAAWTCGIPCQNLTGYQYFYSNVFTVSTDQTLSFSMILNPSTQRFVTTFRGTFTSWELVLEGLEGGATDWTVSNVPNGLADYYFYTHYVSTLQSEFVQNIQSAYSQYPNYQFIFTGHSLGAALTTLAAFDAISNGYLPGNQVIMYNYGSPRVGNIVLAQAIEAAIPEIYRVVHYQDIVPHVPPCVVDLSGDCVSSTGDSILSKIPLAWHAWHVATQIFYNEDNTSYQICTGDEDPNCSDQFSLVNCIVNDHFYYAGVYMKCNGVQAFGSDSSDG